MCSDPSFWSYLSGLPRQVPRGVQRRGRHQLQGYWGTVHAMGTCPRQEKRKPWSSKTKSSMTRTTMSAKKEGFTQLKQSWTMSRRLSISTKAKGTCTSSRHLAATLSNQQPVGCISITLRLHPSEDSSNLVLCFLSSLSLQSSEMSTCSCAGPYSQSLLPKVVEERGKKQTRSASATAIITACLEEGFAVQFPKLAVHSPLDCRLDAS